MDRPSRQTARRVGILVVVFGLIVGLGLVNAISGAPARAGLGQAGVSTTSHPSVTAAGIHPDQTPTSVGLQVNTLTTGFTTYTVLPTTVLLGLTVTNANIVNWYNTTGVDFANTWLWANVTDYVTSTFCGSNNLSAMITNMSAPVPGTPVTEYVSFVLTTAFFANDTKNCPNIDSDAAWLNITATVYDPNNGTGLATGFQYGYCSAVLGIGWCVPTVSSFVFGSPTSQLSVVPVAGEQYTYSLSATYTGQYIGKVQLNVYNPTGTAVILTKNLRYNGTTPTVYNWTQSTPAVYPYTLDVLTAYGTFSSAGVVVVSPATFVYTNVTSWTNSTLIPGLSSGGAGTLLLVVGLIVGMIVALVVGRRVWAGPKPAAPAQPWTPKPGATNQCSVCGQSFATPEELAAHNKSEHGMQ